MKLYALAANDLLSGHSQQKVAKRWGINTTTMSFLARGHLPYVSSETNGRLKEAHARLGRKPYTKRQP